MSGTAVVVWLQQAYRKTSGAVHQKDAVMVEITSVNSAHVVLTNLNQLLPHLEEIYKDVHANPELSMHETRTAGIAADELRKAGYDVTTVTARCRHRN